MNVLTRFWNQLIGSSEIEITAPILEQGLGPDRQMLLTKIAELERRVEHQRSQITRAKSLLQNAGFLARYHQPTLARDISGWIAEADGSGDGAQGSSATPVWSVRPASAGDRASA